MEITRRARYGQKCREWAFITLSAWSRIPDGLRVIRPHAVQVAYYLFAILVQLLAPLLILVAPLLAWLDLLNEERNERLRERQREEWKANFLGRHIASRKDCDCGEEHF